MDDVIAELAALTHEFEEERKQNRRFRRLLEDLLYNLEEENMPMIANRIRGIAKGEISYSLPSATGASSARLTATGLTVGESDGDSETAAVYTAQGPCLLSVYENAGARRADMKTLCIGEDGYLFAVNGEG